MPKPRISVQEAASAITDSVLQFSAQATQQIGGLLLPRESFLKRVFSFQHRIAERLEILKLNCDIVIPHITVAEYNLEHSDYWDRDNSDIVDLVRQMSFKRLVRHSKQPVAPQLTPIPLSGIKRKDLRFTRRRLFCRISQKIQ